MAIQFPRRSLQSSPGQFDDLRRTFRTGLSECDVDFETSERIVGHLTPQTRNKTASIYDRYDYWPKKRSAMKKWEARLRTILDSDCEVPGELSPAPATKQHRN